VILFWVICTILVVIALAFILPPLFQRPATTQAATDKERREANIEIYRDQLAELEADLHNGIVSRDQYQQDRDEIERRLLEDMKRSESETKTVDFRKRNVVYALAIGLPLIAVLFYLKVGELKALSPSASEMQRPAAEPSGQMRSQQQIEANVSKLVERLKSNPNDAEGWVMLARSYNTMERFGEAAGAYARATELQPDNADLWAEYAFVSAMANGRNLEGQPMELVNKALKIDPENLKALQLAGNDAFQRKDYKKAVDYWSRVLKKVPAESEVAQSIQQRIDEAKSLATTK
jgi:cytochrome c-type biogenesis protein CcmH